MSQNLRVALLIDADNVSTDVIEQAISRLHAEYGALHVRRAYGTAEAAVKHQALFKRLSIRPMVNLAAGKNSTDIALAVDALDLVISERPDVVVIASSDSDFAPLVARIREKGCLVRGIGQRGKVGEETPLIYDDWLEFEHRRPRSRAADGAADADDGAGSVRAAKKTRSRARAVATPAPVAPAPAASAAVDATAPAAVEATAPAVKKARKTPARKAAAAKSETAAAEAAATPAPAKKARKTPARTTPARKGAAAAESTAASAAPPAAAAKPRARKTAKASAGKSAAAPAPAVPMPDKVARALEVLPALAAGQAINVQAAAEALRKERVFSNADSWPKFFQRHADWFELVPADKPTQVRRKAP